MKIDIKDLILRLLPVILPFIIGNIPVEKVVEEVKEKLVDALGEEASLLVTTAISELLENIAIELKK